MAKKVLAICASLRSRSNSEILADSFLRGAEDAGCEVSKICLKGKKIAFCRGCFACHDLHRCAIEDDVNSIVEEMRTSDVIVWATPIYFYGMAGEMKTLMDRGNALYSSDYRFRDIYLLTTAGEIRDKLDARTLVGLQGWIDCFKKAQLAGSVLADGIYDSGAITGHPALKKAYDMGKRIKP